jgi:C-terminal processing protease CtpA/Prc
MKSLKMMPLVLAGLAAAPLAARADHAAPTPKATPAPAATTGQPSQEQLEQQLDQARQQLQDAAHRVADLSMRLNGNAMGRMAAAQARIEKLNHRGFLGIDLNDDGDTGSSGVEVSGVTPGGPADKGGLREGDFITGINGTSFKGSGDDGASDKLTEFMRNTKPGDSLKVAYTRDGKAGTASVTAGSVRDMGGYSFSFDIPPMPPMAPMAPMPPMAPEAPMAPRAPWNMYFNSGYRWGEMQLAALTPGLGQYFGTDKGLLVMHVPKDSKLQLQEGDVITQLGGRDPGSAPHAMRILSSYGPGENVKIDVMRKGKPLTLNVTLPKSNDDDSSTWIWSPSDDDTAPSR